MKLTFPCPACHGDIPVTGATTRPTPGDPFSVTIDIPTDDIAAHLTTCTGNSQ